MSLLMLITYLSFYATNYKFKKYLLIIKFYNYILKLSEHLICKDAKYCFFMCLILILFSKYNSKSAFLIIFMRIISK